MDFAVEGVSLVAVIMGLSELIKFIGFNTKFIPLFNVVFGILACVVFISPSNIPLGVLQGMTVGLSAGGFYSGAKNIVEGVKEVK